MPKKNEAHDLVIESLTDALLQIMEKKHLSEINISELCNRAGVSRISFYRNYSSLEDILVRHLVRCTDKWWIEFSQKEPDYFYQNFWVELLEQYRQNEILIKLLYAHNVSHIIKEHIFTCCGPSSVEEEKNAYARAILAGALYGFIDEWIRRGMPELPPNFSFRTILSEFPS